MFKVKCDGLNCTREDQLTIKSVSFNPVNELPEGWRVITWMAPAPVDDEDETSPQQVAMQGFAKAIKGVNPQAGQGLDQMAQAMEIQRKLTALKRVQIRRACVCPDCAGKLVLGSAEVVAEITPSPMLDMGGVPGFLPPELMG